MKTVVVIGAGTMGSGIAQVCALRGLHVRLLDVQADALERAEREITRSMNRQQEKGKITSADVEAARRRIQRHPALSGHLEEAQLIIEAVSERPDVKASVFRQMDAEADDTAILASNTSSISITRLAAYTRRPEAVIGMHFFNPVPVMQLVEVVRGLHTSDETVQRTTALAERLGKVPVSVNDAPGFVSNRVLMPMINEAAFCLMEGVAEPQAIDDVMRLGMAHPMGPLALADLIGLDVCVDILDVLHRELGEDKYRACPLLRKMVDGGQLGRKSGRGFFAYDA